MANDTIKVVKFEHHKKSTIFSEGYLNIFTDASMTRKGYNNNQGCIYGAALKVTEDAKTFIEFDPYFVNRDNVDMLELLAIHMVIKELNKPKYDILLKDIKQINVFSDSLNSVNKLRFKLQNVNRSVMQQKILKHNNKKNISEEERSTKLGNDIVNHVLFLGIPINVFHIKAHLYRKNEIDIDTFMDFYRQENFGATISKEDAKTLMYYNNVVDFKVRSLNHNYTVDFAKGQLYD